MAVDFLCSSASFLTLSSMSIERYKMLTTSYIRIKHSSKLRVIILISLSWILPFSTWIPVIVIFRNINGVKQSGRCYFPGTFLFFYFRLKIIFFLFCFTADAPIVLSLSILLYHLPLICMVTFYTKLIVHIKKSSSKNLSNQALNQELESHTLSSSSKRFALNETSYHDYIYRQIYSLNRKSINNISNNNYTKLYLNNSPTETTINNNKNDFVNSQYLMYHNNASNCLIKKICCFKNDPSKVTGRRKSSNLNNVNINFRKCTLSIPPDSTSLSSAYKEENKRISTINKDVNYELKTLNEPANIENNSKIVKFMNKKTNGEKFQRFSFKPRYSSFSLRANSLRRNRSHSSFYTQSFLEQKTENFDSLNYQKLRVKRNRKAARMLGILVAAFTICWLPFTIIYPLSQFYPNLLPDYVHAIIWWLGYLNSAINPFLYVYSNKIIRRSVRNLLYTQFLHVFCRKEAQRRDSLIQNNTSIRRIIARHNKRYF